MLKYLKLVTTGLCIFIGSTVQAQKPVTIGVTISSTGPAASLGIAQRNTIELFPRTLMRLLGLAQPRIIWLWPRLATKQKFRIWALPPIRQKIKRGLFHYLKPTR